MIKKVLDKVKSGLRGRLLYLAQFGSHLYGLNTENSDLDFRGIYVPTINDLILHKDKDEINEDLVMEEHVIEEYVRDEYCKGYFIPRKTDVKLFSLQKFIILCSKADTNALDLLFSIENNFIEKYINYDRNTTDSVIWQLYSNRSKLINTSRLESPISYAFKQATKYGIKGERLNVLHNVLTKALELTVTAGEHFVADLVSDLRNDFDGKHLKIDSLDNKGKLENYLFVCGVQHQFNTPLDTFIKRIEEKIDREYTSERTKNAKDGNDWKALSHAVRVLLEVQELMETGTVRFPLRQRDFLLDIKLGKIEREVVDEYFKEHLSGLMECIEQNTLNWEYDEEFWNKFIVRVTKGRK